MDVIWRRRTASVRDVANALDSHDLAYTTVMTIMSRLTEKGLLNREPSGRAYIYAPRLTREAYEAGRARIQARGLIDEFGDIAVAQFAAELQDVDPERARRLGELLRRRGP